MEKNTLGQHIVEYRKKNKLTQQKLADILYVSNKTVSRWELGYTEPDLDQVARLAELMGISVDVLLGKASLQEQTDEAGSDASLVRKKRIWIPVAGISAAVAVALTCILVFLFAFPQSAEEDGYEVCTRFEAEYAILEGDNPQLDGQRGFVEYAPTASNGQCVAYFGAKGNTMTFDFFASQQDGAAFLTIAVVSRWDHVLQEYVTSKFDNVWTLVVNGKIVKTDVIYQSTDNSNPFYDFVDVTVEIGLVEGENKIKLICPATGDGAYGLNVDYIEIESAATLRWKPYKENVVRKG